MSCLATHTPLTVLGWVPQVKTTGEKEIAVDKNNIGLYYDGTKSAPTAYQIEGKPTQVSTQLH